MPQPREIQEAVPKLAPTERAAIASEILDSQVAWGARWLCQRRTIAGGHGNTSRVPISQDSGYGQLSPAWEDEIQRRLREAEAGRAETMPAERVFAEVEAEPRPPQA